MRRTRLQAGVGGVLAGAPPQALALVIPPANLGLSPLTTTIQAGQVTVRTTTAEGVTEATAGHSALNCT